MNTVNSYSYRADRPSAYKALALYVMDLDINFTLLPKRDIIIVEIPEDAASILSEINCFIEESDHCYVFEEVEVNESTMYDLISDPEVDANTLRKVIDLLLEVQKQTNKSQATDNRELNKKIADLKEDLLNKSNYVSYLNEKCSQLEERISAIRGAAESLRYLCGSK